jgi:hypothetical protein
VRSLPYIEQELDRHLEKINQDLNALPGPPSSAPLSEVLRLITDFTREVERQGEGIPGRNGLLHQIKQPQDNFRVAVRRTAPCFVPQYRGRAATPTIEVSEPELSQFMDFPGPFSASATSASATSTSATLVSVPQAVEIHTRPPFLTGEENSGEISLNDGKEVFIDDVLQTAEWCVP